MNATQERLALLTQSLKNRERWLVVIESTAYLAITLTALLGNTLFISAFYKTRTLRSPQNYYLVSLAVADILNAVVCMPITLVVLSKGTWPFSDFTCQFQGSLIAIFATVSLLTLGIIAINRYVKIVRSATLYMKIFSQKTVLMSIVMSWIATAFFTYVIYFPGKTVNYFHPGKCLCFVQINLKEAVGLYSTIMYSSTIFISFSLIIFSYYKVYRKIRAHFVHIRTSSLHDDNSAAFAEEVKITTMLFTTILAFFICWTPSVIIDFYEVLGGYYTLPRQVYMLNVFTYASSSAVNPMIYGLMKREFKEAYKRVLCCKKEP